MLRGRNSSRGQVTVEMAVMFAFLVAGIVAMAVYFQRAVQGGMRSNSDSFGTQFSATEGWNSVTTSNTNETNISILSNQNTNYNQALH